MKIVMRSEVKGGQQFHLNGRWFTAIEETYEKIGIKKKWSTHGEGLWHVTDRGFVMWVNSTELVEVA